MGSSSSIERKKAPSMDTSFCKGEEQAVASKVTGSAMKASFFSRSNVFSMFLLGMVVKV
jgi:hypothetical protein